MVNHQSMSDSKSLVTGKRDFLVRLRAVSYFSLQLLHAKPKHAKAAINGGVRSRRKNETVDSFVLSGDNEAVKVI